MWVLLDFHTQQRLSIRYPTLAALARFMGLTKQYLHQSIKAGKNVFTFKGKKVVVVNQIQASFAVLDSPLGKPVKGFENMAEMAKWIGVSRQAVYAAFKRWDPREGHFVTKDEQRYYIDRISPTKGNYTTPWDEEKLTMKKSKSTPIRIISDTSTTDYPSIASAAKALGIDARTIPSALERGRDYFTRRQDGQTFRMKMMPSTLDLPPKPTPHTKSEALSPQPPPLTVAEGQAMERLRRKIETKSWLSLTEKEQEKYTKIRGKEIDINIARIRDGKKPMY